MDPKNWINMKYSLFSAKLILTFVFDVITLLFIYVQRKKATSNQKKTENTQEKVFLNQDSEKNDKKVCFSLFNFVFSPTIVHKDKVPNSDKKHRILLVYKETVQNYVYKLKTLFY